MNYKISMKKGDFFKIHNKISTKNLSIFDDFAEFEVEMGAYNLIKESGYEYKLKESLKTKMIIFFKSYYLLIIGIVFLFSVLYINSYRVDKIYFNITTPINAKIEYEIKSQYKKLFCFNFADINYTELSNRLQKKYIEYPYIAVYTSNNNIKVDIYKEDEYPTISSITYGNIVSKKDAIIDEYYIYSGDSLIYKNKYVKSGDILVSAKNQRGGQALILGYVYERITINIPLNEEVLVSTGNYQKYNNINIFGHSFDFKKKNKYEIMSKSEKTIFNFFDIFIIKEFEEIEKNVIIKENNEAMAIELAKKQIEAEFNEGKVSDLERIIDIYDYNITMKDGMYNCVFIIKKLESIGELKAL